MIALSSIEQFSHNPNAAWTIGALLFIYLMCAGFTITASKPIGLAVLNTASAGRFGVVTAMTVPGC